MLSFIKKLRAELLCMLEQLLIASAVALLPGRTYVQALILLSRFHSVFVDVAPAADRMRAWFPGRYSKREAERALALHRLIDIADYYLTLLKGRHWIARNVIVNGRLVERSSFDVAPMMCTFHYGQGFWALPYFRSFGLHCSFLHLPPPPAGEVALGGRLHAWLGHRRIAQVSRLSRAPSIPVGGSLRKMRRRFFQERQSVLVMPDVPPNPDLPTLPVTLLGRKARLPAGALSLAADEGVPVYVYTMVLNTASGMRHLDIHGPFFGDTSTELADRLASYLTTAIHRNPAAWHLWAWVDTFMAGE